MSRAQATAHDTPAAPAPSAASKTHGAAQPIFACLSAFLAWLFRLKPVERFRAGAARMLAEIAPLLFDPETFVAHDCLEEDDRRNLTLLLDDAEAMLSAHIWLAARARAGLAFRRAVRPPRKRVRMPMSTTALLRRWLQLQARLARADRLVERLASRFTASDLAARASGAGAIAYTRAPVIPTAPHPASTHEDKRGLHLLARALAILRLPSFALSEFRALQVPPARAPAQDGSPA